jgi:hypothetical protein
MKNLIDCIQRQIPFDCEDWDELCNSIVTTYDVSWNISLVWILASVRTVVKNDGIGGWKLECSNVVGKSKY